MLYVDSCQLLHGGTRFRATQNVDSPSLCNRNLPVRLGTRGACVSQSGSLRRNVAEQLSREDSHCGVVAGLHGTPRTSGGCCSSSPEEGHVHVRT